MKEIILVRHGKTEANKEGRYLGRTDVPLCDDGKKELHDLWNKRSDASGVRVVFSSPMIRCLESSEIIIPGMTPVVIEELREIDFGRFELKTYKELSGDEDYQRYIDSGGTLPFPEGESREGFIERSFIGYNKCAEYMDNHSLTKGLIALHGGSIMAIMSSLTGEDYYSFRVENGKGYIVRYDDSNVITEFVKIE